MEESITPKSPSTSSTSEEKSKQEVEVKVKKVKVKIQNKKVKKKVEEKENGKEESNGKEGDSVSNQKEYCNSLTVRELKIIAKHYKMKTSQTKPKLIEQIISIYKNNVTGESPRSIIERNKTQIEEDIENEKSRKLKTKELENIKKKDFSNLIENKDLGFFNGLPKDCFQHILSFLNEYEELKFSITNKVMRKLCLNPVITRTTMKNVDKIRNSRFWFVPKKLGLFLNLPKKLEVNRYYIITSKLFYYLFIEFFKNDIDMKHAKRNPKFTKLLNRKLHIKYSEVYIKESLLKKMEITKLGPRRQQQIRDATLHQTHIRLGYFMHRLMLNAISFDKIASMKWDIDMDLAFWVYEQELQYESVVDRFIKE